MSDPVANLLALHQHISTLPEAWAAEVCDGLDRLLEGEAESLDAALGLQNGAGQSWRQRLVLARRDQFIRAASIAYPGLCGPRQARALARELSADLTRYRASAWRRDRTKTTNPYLVADRRHYFFRALEASDRDLGESAVRAILAGANG